MSDLDGQEREALEMIVHVLESRRGPVRTLLERLDRIEEIARAALATGHEREALPGGQRREVPVPLTGRWYEERLARCVDEYTVTARGGSSDAFHIGELRGLAEGMCRLLVEMERREGAALAVREEALPGLDRLAARRGRSMSHIERELLAAREEPHEDGDATWADHANRIADAERVIDGTAYVPAIEAYCVVRDLQAMQGDGVLYSPEKRDGVFRWVAACEEPRDRKAMVAALRILQDRSIGSPEANGRAIDVLIRSLTVEDLTPSAAREDIERPDEGER